MDAPAILALCSLLLQASSLCTAAAQHKEPVQEGFRNTSKNVAYVGSEACAGCHSPIYASYEGTDMGQSMAVVAGAKLDTIPAGITIRSEQLNRNYSVSRERDGIYESDYELDSSGAEVFRNTQRLEYVVGSGANATTFLVRRGDFLFEAPLTYYARIQNGVFRPATKRRTSDSAGLYRQRASHAIAVGRSRFHNREACSAIPRFKSWQLVARTATALDSCTWRSVAVATT